MWRDQLFVWATLLGLHIDDGISNAGKLLEHIVISETASHVISGRHLIPKFDCAVDDKHGRPLLINIRVGTLLEELVVV